MQGCFEAGHRRGQLGLSIIELVVVVSLLALLLGLALARFSRAGRDLPAAGSSLLGDIRVARTLAISRNLHYRVRVAAAGQYVLERLQDPDNDGIWTLEGVERTVALPSQVVFANDQDAFVEYDSRGFVSTKPAGGCSFRLRDNRTSQTREVQVLGSGLAQDSATGGSLCDD